LELLQVDSRSVYFSEGNVERRKGGIVSDSFRVDEKSAVVLRFKGFVVVAICVGGVVKKDKS